MNATALTESPALLSLRQQATAWWRGRTRRERQAVQLVGAVLVLFIVWSILIAPAWRTIRAAPAELDALEAQLQQMQQVAAEGRALRGTVPVGAQQAGAALRAASDRLGDRGRLNLQGDRAILNVTGISPEALRGWLAEVRANARARPVEAQLQRSATGYSGSLTVSIGGAP